MHEITLCQRALELIEQQASAYGAKTCDSKPDQIWRIFTCGKTSALSFCFDLVCRGTIAEGCKLHLEEQEAECWCEHCQQYVVVNPPCTSLSRNVASTLRIVADDGLQIRRARVR